MRTMTLLELVDEFRNEARLSGDVAHGSHLLNRHKALLRRTQEDLHGAYDWPNLNIVRTVMVPAGQRYTAYPAQVRFQNVKTAYQKDLSGDWRELVYGVELEHLNDVDSDADERRENPERWAHYLDATDTIISNNMFELWPIPNRSLNVRFHAKRELLPLTDDAHTTTLDGPMIAMFAAAEVLASQKAEDAPFKLQKAQQRFDLIRRRMMGPDNQKLVTSRPVHALPGGQRFRIPE